MKTQGKRMGPLVAAGVVLGAGIGGLFDGIVLQQLLQWHDIRWDGAFHALTWTMCAIGIALLFRARRRPDVTWSKRLLVGSMLGGWGLFNLVEGVIDHFVLGLHHVHPGADQMAWDLGFVVIGGAGLMLLGYAVARGVRVSPLQGLPTRGPSAPAGSSI